MFSNCPQQDVVPATALQSAQDEIKDLKRELAVFIEKHLEAEQVISNLREELRKQAFQETLFAPSAEFQMAAPPPNQDSQELVSIEELFEAHDEIGFLRNQLTVYEKEIKDLQREVEIRKEFQLDSEKENEMLREENAKLRKYRECEVQMAEIGKELAEATLNKSE
ncbi:hypothetical protein B9Z55_025962 [Caenorhabditis nigoni]|uniref:Uncharacterized protein n=1 Tax=Caenorhabditis nigoni TaxID=1611254 RepID=A0A2G5T153_9PELO|nr:hypothetical protein B9Z55_025962 [Caenorhabditis nigoni]